MTKIELTEQDLLGKLRDQVGLLTSYAAQFDGGHRQYALPMATACRVLFHQREKVSPGQGALLHQLGLRNGRWRSVGGPKDPRDEFLACKLVLPRMSSVMKGTPAGLEHSDIEAACDPVLVGPRRTGMRRVPFETWWSEPIAYNVSTSTYFSRREVVMHIADTDGGAHVDGRIDAAYAKLKEGDFLGLRAMFTPNMAGLQRGHPAGGVAFPGSAEACIRTIVHEVLLTLQERVPDAFEGDYEWQDSTMQSAGPAKP